MIDPAALRRRPALVDRSGDRWVAVAAIAIGVAFLAVALGTLALPAETRRGAWLPLHLALAGGASATIAGVMPFFSAAFAAAPPSDIRLRCSAVLTVALGAGGVAIGVSAGATAFAAAAGVTFIVGVVLTGVVTVRPLRGALGASRGLITEGYVVALAEVAVGATVATLFVAGWPPVLEAWGHLKPAHAWLNLVGFVSLVIATTLLHFFPTVIGARIASHPSARVTVVGLALGAPLVATGFTVSSDLLARAAALVTLAGAAGLAAYARRVWPTRGRWTTDLDWHRFAMLGLISAVAWFEVSLLIAAGRVLAFGSAPEAWSIEALVGPFVGGWVGSAVLASATHLLPAIGPGDPAVHARQRAILGRLAVARLASLEIGVAGLAVGIPFALPALVAIGGILSGIALVATAGLLLRALAFGLR